MNGVMEPVNGPPGPFKNTDPGKLAGARYMCDNKQRSAFLKVERQFRKDPQPVEAHLDRIEGTARLAVIGRRIPGIRHDREVGVYIEEVVDTGIPDQVFRHLV